MTLTVAQFQDRVRRLYLEKDRRRGTDRTLLWLVEEVGELSEAVRGKRGDAAEELADVIAWTASVANLLDVDLEAALERKYPSTCPRCGGVPCKCLPG